MYDELIERAKICLLEARLAINEDAATELLRKAKEYQRKAAELDNGKMPDIGDD